jgi:hypothetical protein
MANSADLGLYISDYDSAGPSTTRLILFDLSPANPSSLSAISEMFSASQSENVKLIRGSIVATILLLDTESQWGDNFLGAFSVYQSAARSGMGKAIYSLAMSYANSLGKPMMPDPESVTESAYRIWSHFYYISKEPKQKLASEFSSHLNSVLDSVYWKKTPDVNFLAYQNNFDRFMASRDPSELNLDPLSAPNLEAAAKAFFRGMMNF